MKSCSIGEWRSECLGQRLLTSNKKPSLTRIGVISHVNPKRERHGYVYTARWSIGSSQKIIAVVWYMRASFPKAASRSWTVSHCSQFRGCSLSPCVVAMCPSCRKPQTAPKLHVTFQYTIHGISCRQAREPNKDCSCSFSKFYST